MRSSLVWEEIQIELKVIAFIKPALTVLFLKAPNIIFRSVYLIISTG